MTEELNQVSEVTEDFEDLFTDLEDTDLSDNAEVSEETDTPTEETSTEVPSFLDIDYMDEVKHLSKEEAKTLSQKGMDYDRIRTKYDSMKGFEKSIETIKRLAQANNMEVDAYMTNLENMQNQFETNRKMQEMREEYPDVDDEVLERLAKAELGNLRTEEANKPDPMRIEMERQVDMFEKVYPNVDWSKLPDEVLRDVEKGYTLLEAYQSFERANINSEMESLKSRLNIQEKNEANKRKSLGNMSSGDESAGDDFLSGFFG